MHGQKEEPMTRRAIDDTLNLDKEALDFVEQEKFQVEEKVIYSGRKKGACIVFITGPSRGNVVAVHKGTMTIGRDQASDIVINKQYVSKKHAQIISSDEGTKIVDCESTNGTFLNDTLIEQAELKDRDEIKIGSVIMQYFRIDLNDAAQERVPSALEDHEPSAFYNKVFAEVQPFFGQMASRFLGRQIRSHLGKSPRSLEVSDKESLARWLRISAGLLLNEETADTLAEKILALE